MRRASTNLLGTVFGVVSLFYSLQQPDAAHASDDPLMNRVGKTLVVQINGMPTKSTAASKVTDSAGMEAYETYWTASALKGPLCFTIDPKDPRLGTVEKIDVMLHEVRPDRPYQQWKNYQSVPTPTEDLPAFSSSQGFCPKEFILTERLRYPTLPPGDYVLRVAYWGVGNWDRQDIRFTVNE